MQELRITNIRELDEVRDVYDLNVPSNHNFFISPKGDNCILTHNCDYITREAQAALRNLMEEYSDITRFILTSNYIERVSDPIVSRTQTFQVRPPSKKETALHLVDILQKEGIEYDISSVGALVNAHYPDIRKIINSAQQCSRNGKLNVDQTYLNSSNYDSQILDILKGNYSPEEKVIRVRQVVADNSITDFDRLYRMLFDKIEEYASQSIAQTTIHIADGQYRSAFVPDKEINFAATLFNILT